MVKEGEGVGATGSSQDLVEKNQQNLQVLQMRIEKNWI